MKEYSTKNIINLALAGHSSSGKTILTESMLLNAGVINKMGSIQEGTTTSDYHDYEIEDQHSISLSLINFEWLDKKFNVLDSPGLLDFQGELRSAFRVADFAGIVVNSGHGIEVGTEVAWDSAHKELEVPRLFIVNMIDNTQSDFDKVLARLQERFGRTVFPFMIPVQEGPEFNQVADVLRKEIFTFKTDGSGKYEESEADGNWAEKLNTYHNELIELIAESDDSLLEKFFESGELTEDELRSGLHSAFMKEGLIPVFCTSGENNIGVQRMMDILARYAPCAGDFEEVIGAKSLSGDEIHHGSTVDDHVAALVFKTMSEAHLGELSFFRVYSGTVKPGDSVLNSTRNQSEKMRQVYYMNGKNKKEATRLIAGDIGAALKMKNTHTCDTLASEASPIILQKIKFPTANMSIAVHPTLRGDEEKIANGLSIMHEEDPTFEYRVDPELGQTIVSGQGEAHLKQVLYRITSRFGVEISKEKPKIPYRETITADSSAKYRHKKQSGGSGQFAEVWMKITPAQRGEGIDFKHSLVGQNVDRSFVPSVERGIGTVCTDGILAGCKVVDVKIDFYDGKMHPVDSNDMAFQIAGKHAFTDAFNEARPKLLEPIYKIQIKIPEDAMGDIMGDISSRRGRVGGMEADGHFQIINAEVPQATMQDYSTALRSMSSGRGMFKQEFSHYEDMPTNEAEKVINHYQSERALGH